MLRHRLNAFCSENKRITEGVSYFVSMCSVGETSGLDVPVARGPVPRDLHRLNVPVARGPVPRDHWMTRAIARDRPSPYGEGAFFIVVRGPVPRDCWMTRAMARETRSHARLASEGPSPTVKGWRFFIVVRGPVPRERWIARTMARETRSHARLASEGPSPTMKGDLLPTRPRARRPIASRPGGLSYGDL